MKVDLSQFTGTDSEAREVDTHLQILQAKFTASGTHFFEHLTVVLITSVRPRPVDETAFATEHGEIQLSVGLSVVSVIYKTMCLACRWPSLA